MRELEFRYRYEQHNHLTGKDTIVTRFYTIDEIEQGVTKVYLDGEKLLSRDQFIGLRDKNDKKIYEEDYITAKWENDKIRGKVVFDEGCFSVEWHIPTKSKNKYPPAMPPLFDLECIEIIGNVWESPELLEATK